MVVTAAGVSVDQVFTGDFSRNECFRTAGIPSDNKISTRLVVQFLRSKHCNEYAVIRELTKPRPVPDGVRLLAKPRAAIIRDHPCVCHDWHSTRLSRNHRDT